MGEWLSINERSSKLLFMKNIPSAAIFHILSLILCFFLARTTQFDFHPDTPLHPPETHSVLLYYGDLMLVCREFLVLLPSAKEESALSQECVSLSMCLLSTCSRQVRREVSWGS